MTSASRESQHSAFDDEGECDDCGRHRLLAVTPSGRYCWECIPDDDLARMLKDLSGE